MRLLQLFKKQDPRAPGVEFQLYPSSPGLDKFHLADGPATPVFVVGVTGPNGQAIRVGHPETEIWHTLIENFQIAQNTTKTVPLLDMSEWEEIWIWFDIDSTSTSTGVNITARDGDSGELLLATDDDAFVIANAFDLGTIDVSGGYDRKVNIRRLGGLKNLQLRLGEGNTGTVEITSIKAKRFKRVHGPGPT